MHEVLPGRERERSDRRRGLADRREVGVRVRVAVRRRAQRDRRLGARAVERGVDGAQLSVRPVAGVDRAGRVGYCGHRDGAGSQKRGECDREYCRARTGDSVHRGSFVRRA